MATMDNRASFIELFVGNDCPVYGDDIDTPGANRLYGHWESLGYRVGKWRGSSREGKYVYCHTSRFVPKHIKENDVLEYIVVPGFKNPRWIILHEKNVFSRHGLIIKPTSLKARIVWTGAKILSKLNLATVVFPDRLFVKGSAMGATVFAGHSGIPNILYTGAVGRYQKFTIQYVDKNNRPVYYLKLANSPAGIGRINNEYNSLRELSKINLEHMEIPKPVETVENDRFFGLMQSNILTDEKVTSFLTKKDILAVSELYQKLGFREISLSEYLKKINFYQHQDDLSMVDDYLESQKGGKILLAGSHGDYIPWNRFISAGRVKVIDWETFKYRPLFYDLCYFLAHKTVLIRKKSLPSAINEIFLFINDLLSHLNESACAGSIDIRLYVLLNLLELYVHYKGNDYAADQYFLKNIKDGIVELHKQCLI